MTDSRSSLFSLSIIVFARLFQKAVSSTDSGGRTPQSAKSSSGVFFLIAFSFAPVYAKEKADRHKFFALSVSYTLGFARRVEHCSPAKKYKVTFLIMFFSLVRKERKGQKEEGIPLLNTFCRLAATGANKVPRPSRYSLTTATGSKRLSADSDSLLCHVRLWRTSRVEILAKVWVRT